MYAVSNGFRKLVPAGTIGYPGYTAIGTFYRDENDTCPECGSNDLEYLRLPDTHCNNCRAEFSSNENNYLIVELSLFEDTSNNKWMSEITIKDGDDFYYQRFLDFTMENWLKQLNTYNEINQVDRFVMEYLKLEGFK